MKKGIIATCIAIAALSLAPAFSQANRPWYAARLESLGFTVFAKPVAVDDFTLPNLAGENVKLSAQRGKIVILNFWATWCPPCREEMPAIESLWQGMKGSNFSIMGVSVGEETKTVRDFIAKNKFSYPVYLDSTGGLGEAFNARSIPTTYVIDKNGMVIAGKVGGADYGSKESLAIFTELAAR